MTDYRVTLKSNIQSVEINKKNVKINCHNNNAGKLVVTTLNQNISTVTRSPTDSPLRTSKLNLTAKMTPRNSMTTLLVAS